MKKSVKNHYDHQTIESIWQSKWENEGIYHPDLDSANGSASSPLGPFYNLMMFPYPSAEGLHVGSMYTFSGVDVYGRFKRMQGHDVFEPIGLDGFGIHSENHAIKMGTHPMEHAKTTEKTFYRQLREIGNGFAWDNKLETYDPDYYKWTQWLFVQLFKMGLAYRKKAPVNFCPSCKTVLADEQVITKSKIKNPSFAKASAGKQKSKISENQSLDQPESEKDLEKITVNVCERCETEIEKKNLEQWFFRITNYADRLLANIDGLNWTEKIKIAQKEWIGKKEGIEISFKIADSKEEVTVFTTTPINFGATFIVVAPEHPLLSKIVTPDQKNKVDKYIKKSMAKSEIERLAEKNEKTGVFTGSYAINHLTREKIPVWVADYVLIGYGTGAVQGCPGHDERDFEFAKKYNLPIPRVVTGPSGETGSITDHAEQVKAGISKGKMINSGFLNGMEFIEAMEKTKDHFEEKGWGKRVATYHLRDWLISRQRYWGPPIPMIFCESCAKEEKSWFTSSEHSDLPAGQAGNSASQKIRRSDKSESQTNRSSESSEFSEMAGWYPVPEKDLPVELPFIEDFKPLGTGKSPLGNHPEFYEVKCPQCGSEARRETDVSDTFLDSAWYFLRYLATDWEDMPFPSVEFARIKNQESRIKEKIGNWKLKIGNSSRRLAWLPVTMYIGGAEHAVMHLLYARFMTMAIHDMGLISFEEPFKRFYAHGLIIKDGAKMSKSKGNVVNPDVYIKKYGADTLRTYLRFLGPFDQTGDFKDEGIDGMNRFLKKVWKLFNQQMANGKWQMEDSADKLRMMHQTIKNVTGELEELRFNTAIAYLMTWYNFLAKQKEVSSQEAENYLKMLAPFAPHMTEELYQRLKGKASSVKGKGQKELHASPFTLHPSIHTSSWPTFDEKYLVSDTVKIPVQVNGKLRSALEVATADAADQAKIEELAREDENVSKFLEGQKIKKAIYIKGKVLNFVV